MFIMYIYAYTHMYISEIFTCIYIYILIFDIIYKHNIFFLNIYMHVFLFMYT